MIFSEEDMINGLQVFYMVKTERGIRLITEVSIRNSRIWLEETVRAEVLYTTPRKKLK